MSNEFTSEQIDTFTNMSGDGLEAMVGKVFFNVTTDNDDCLLFHHVQGTIEFYHPQDCCESCYIESIDGDIRDLIGHPLLMAELVTSDENPPHSLGYTPDSFTWSFYKFATVKGYVTVRWFGSSNGYYGETVSTRWLAAQESK